MAILFFGVVVAALLWTTISGVEAWPFSSYPMFSTPLRLSDVTVIRLALERHDGEIVWWRSRFFRYPEFIGRRIRLTYRAEAAVAKLERLRLLQEATRLIRLEDEDGYRAILIIERTATAGPGGIRCCDRTLARVPFDAPERGDGGR